MGDVVRVPEDPIGTSRHDRVNWDGRRGERGEAASCDAGAGVVANRLGPVVRGEVIESVLAARQGVPSDGEGVQDARTGAETVHPHAVRDRVAFPVVGLVGVEVAVLPAAGVTWVRRAERAVTALVEIRASTVREAHAGDWIQLPVPRPIRRIGSYLVRPLDSVQLVVVREIPRAIGVGRVPTPAERSVALDYGPVGPENRDGVVGTGIEPGPGDVHDLLWVVVQLPGR